eukprot:128692-Pyramimonas_sp.AAC.1
MLWLCIVMLKSPKWPIPTVKCMQPMCTRIVASVHTRGIRGTADMCACGTDAGQPVCACMRGSQCAHAG